MKSIFKRHKTVAKQVFTGKVRFIENDKKILEGYIFGSPFSVNFGVFSNSYDHYYIVDKNRVVHKVPEYAIDKIS